MNDGRGNTNSFGYAPDEKKEGKPYAPDHGQVHTNDSETYQSTSYSRTIEITDAQYFDMMQFGKYPSDYGFSYSYIGGLNDCINFVWKALEIGGLNPSGSDGLPWPSWNEDETDAIQGPFDDSGNTASPLILDLDGDGVETVGKGSSIHFDHDGNGFAENTGWAGKDDGLLVWDRNGNGLIDDGSELFGNNTRLGNGQQAANGFAALAELDSNHDGKIDASDAAFAQLRVWKDSNGNAKLNEGELLTLEQAKVASLNTGYVNQTQFDEFGNEIRQVGTYTDTAGATHGMNDVWFSVDKVKTVALNQVVVGAEAGALPYLEGFGNVTDLHQAMTKDATGTLKGLVERFATETNDVARRALLDQLIFSWSGADRYTTASRGGYIDDGRKIYALEAFMGKDFVQSSGINAGLRDPGPNAAAKLMQAYDQLALFIGSGLMLQTHFQPLLEGMQWTFANDRFGFDVEALVGLFKAGYISDTAAGSEKMVAFGQALLSAGGGWGKSLLDSLRQAGNINGQGFEYLLASLGQVLGGAYNDELYGNGEANTLMGLAGNDTLYGDLGNDILEGGTGNDYLSGDGGADTYRFARGWGQDTVNNFDTDAASVDILQFYGDIAPGEISATRAGDNLLLSLNGSQDRITVTNYFLNDGHSGYLLEQIRFADGTVWSVEHVKAMVGTATDGNDQLYGYAGADVLSGDAGNDGLYGAQGNDVLTGGLGNDRLEGGSGSDVYCFNLGDGQDVVVENSLSAGDVDVLRFGPGINPGDITVSSVGDGLVLKHVNGTDQITFLSWFAENSPRYQVERIEFADGTLWTGAQLSSALLNPVGSEGDDLLTAVSTSIGQVLNGAGGNDTLTGSRGADTLEGGRGDDRLNGGQGADRYVFNLGDGQDVISDDNGYSSNSDVLAFGVGIAAADIVTSRSGTSLVLNHANGLDRVTILNWFYDTSGRYQLERIEFADGTVWTSAQVTAPLLIQEGGEGDDVITGLSATFNQVLKGNGGSDTLTAGNGNDHLEGGRGNDRLTGGQGSDRYVFNLGDGQDIISDDNGYGSGTDVLIFGAGIAVADIIASRSGTSLVLSHANGQDQVTILNWFYEASDRYKLERFEFADGSVLNGAQITAPLMTIVGSDADDILVGAASGNQSLFGLAGNDTLTAGSSSDRLEGGAGNDVLNAGAGDDVLIGGSGDDRLNGGQGSDRYQFNLGDGQDIISDDNGYGSGVDVLTFGAGISAADISVSRSGTSLVLSHANGQDSVTLLNWFYDTSDRYTLERIEFADGTLWTSGQLTAPFLTQNGSEGDDVITGLTAAFSQTLNGNGGNDTLTGGNGNDRLDGGRGNDQLNGGQGSDRYVFNLGDGQDVISDNNGYGSGTDVLAFGVGIVAADITASRSGTSLVLSHANGLDRVTVLNWFYDTSDRYQLERIEFADGTLWTSAQVTAPLLVHSGGEGDDVITGLTAAFSQTLNGNGGNDTLTGGNGNDRLEGGRGNDRLNGGQGSDRYVFNLGDGQDVISDNNGYGSGTDVLAFGAGIAAADMIASRSGTSLVLSHVNGQEQVTILDWFYEAGDRYKLEKFEFADGTVLTGAQITAPLMAVLGTEGDDTLVGANSGNQMLSGLGGNDTISAGSGNDLLEGVAGNDVLNAGNGDDVLVGGAGNDRLNGGQGSDRYVFNLGDGDDVISDDNGYGSGIDVLAFGAGIVAADITASRSGTSLVLSHANGLDRVTVLNWFYDTSDRYQLERIEFADGTLWTSAQVTAPLLVHSGGEGDDVITGLTAAFSQTLNGNGGNDTLTGGNGNDRLEGGRGNDRLNGGQGSDRYVFNLGDGQDVISDNNGYGSGTDVLAFGAGIAAVDMIASRSGTSLVLSHVNGQEQVTILDWFYEAGDRYKLEKFEFADGTVLTGAQITAPLMAVLGTEGDDTLVGANSGNQMLSGLGGNDTISAGSGNDLLEGGAGNDVLNAGNGDDVLVGGAGNDRLNGGQGSDRYVFNLGDGDDVISDDNGYGSGTDVLAFGAGIVAADITASRSGTSLVLSHANGLDRVTVLNWFYDTSDRYQLERIEFADGTLWTSGQLTAPFLTLNGSEGDDVITGLTAAFSQTLNGNGGNDTLTGG
ncbi:beta strand repeat-containing protein, partial [Pseudomonas fontis]